MGITGKHGKQTGDRTAKNTGGIPRHGGPQTGDGRLSQGGKPKMKDVNIPGVTGKAARMAARILGKKKSE